MDKINNLTDITNIKLTTARKSILEIMINSNKPLSYEDMKDLILNSNSIEDLQTQLFSLLKDADKTQFNELMDRALFAADILGYVHSKEGR